jgi:hypothetical protein
MRAATYTFHRQRPPLLSMSHDVVGEERALDGMGSNIGARRRT